MQDWGLTGRSNWTIELIGERRVAVIGALQRVKVDCHRVHARAFAEGHLHIRRSSQASLLAFVFLLHSPCVCLSVCDCESAGQSDHDSTTQHDDDNNTTKTAILPANPPPSARARAPWVTIEFGPCSRSIGASSQPNPGSIGFHHCPFAHPNSVHALGASSRVFALVHIFAIFCSPQHPEAIFEFRSTVVAHDSRPTQSLV